MTPSVANATVTNPDNSGVIACHRRRATDRLAEGFIERRTPADTITADPLSGAVTEAALRAFGKQGAAAAQLGKDHSNFSRDVRAERLTLRDLSALGAPFLAELGKELIEQYAPLADPKLATQRHLRTVLQLLGEVAQFVDAA